MFDRITNIHNYYYSSAAPPTDVPPGALETIMADLTQLTADVAQNTSVIESARTLIAGMAQQLATAGTDPTKLAALQTQLETETAALANAVAANTPAAAPDQLPTATDQPQPDANANSDIGQAKTDDTSAG